MKSVDYQKINFFNEITSFTIQTDIKENCHSISYFVPNLTKECNLKIEIIVKYDTNFLLFEGTISEYEAVLQNIFNKEITNEIILSKNKNLVLNNEYFLRITISGNYENLDAQTSSKFHLNKLFINSHNAIQIHSYQFTTDLIDTKNYNLFTVLDFEKLILIESKNQFKDQNNIFQSKKLMVHSSYFINTNSHTLTLFDGQKLILNYSPDNELQKFYLIKI